MNEEDILKKHVGSLRVRSTVSVVCYVGFVMAALTMAFQQYSLKHPVTMVSLGMILLAFVSLPRDYKPAHLIAKNWEETALPALSEMDQLQKLGFGLRVVYGVGALFLVGVLPRLVG